ncbi:CinA family protein [Microbacterium invictum]|uniref:Nicotinamide-nucleotide amidase n=1 Tax=Microbacterium invictum TaxID=515415 RepID=A0AA40SQ56_9MICO|nr:MULTISPECIES: CinA family protein [Microbacterium]MBB4140360.1 nicotinamide-nucleotide amidase [Microbacterium invictum]
MSAVDAIVDDIANACLAREMTVGVIESLTSGAVASALGRGHEAAEWFRGGVVAYETETKQWVLGLVPGTDPCSPSCAAQLAANGRALLRADVCASVTGIGGPEPVDDHPAGEVHVGVSTAQGWTTRVHYFDGPPEDVVEQSVLATLSRLYDTLTPTPGPGA